MSKSKLVTAPGYREAYRGEAARMYRDLAEELDGPETAVTILSMMDKRAVALAEAYARRSHKRWPPRPTRSGWSVQVISYAPYDGSPVADTEDLVR